MVIQDVIPDCFSQKNQQIIMGIPTLKLLFDRQKRASRTKEGAIELRITFNRVQKHVTNSGGCSAVRLKVYRGKECAELNL